MFKLVVLSFLAVAAAEPSGLFVTSPLVSSYSAVVAPATTTISKSASSVVHPSPVYSAFATPVVYNHFIKKRSPQLYPYYAPGALVASAPLVTPLISSPVVPSPAVVQYSAAALPLATTHFIKKRSAPLLSTGAVIASHSYAAPLLSSTYAAPVFSSPFYSSPITYSTPITHFIKKRSAPLLSTGAVIASHSYAAPLLSSTYAAPVFSSPFYSSPITYSTPITHFIKKRSAPFLTTYLAPGSYSHQSRIDLINHPSPILKVASYQAPLSIPVVY